MKKSSNFEMFIQAKDYIDKYHSNNPLDFVTNVYIFIICRVDFLML